jgi:mRNA-degrading endonuclease RelE of RelBE toxin-antitoxin system
VSRNRKPLPGLSPSFARVAPVWELRVGDYRVFYDIEQEERAVCVRAVRFKGQSTTEETT